MNRYLFPLPRSPAPRPGTPCRTALPKAILITVLAATLTTTAIASEGAAAEDTCAANAQALAIALQATATFETQLRETKAALAESRRDTADMRRDIDDLRVHTGYSASRSTQTGWQRLFGFIRRAHAQETPDLAPDTAETRIDVDEQNGAVRIWIKGREILRVTDDGVYSDGPIRTVPSLDALPPAAPDTTAQGRSP